MTDGTVELSAVDVLEQLTIDSVDAEIREFEKQLVALKEIRKVLVKRDSVGNGRRRSGGGSASSGGEQKPKDIIASELADGPRSIDELICLTGLPLASLQASLNRSNMFEETADGWRLTKTP